MTTQTVLRPPITEGLRSVCLIFLPVIIYTAYSIYKNDFSAVAADHYVVKSSVFDKLKSKIKEILSW